MMSRINRIILSLWFVFELDRAAHARQFEPAIPKVERCHELMGICAGSGWLSC
jgi:hypothetical protein